MHVRTNILFSFTVVALITCFLKLLAQDPYDDRLLEYEQENEEDDALIHYLEWRRANPVDINQASATELTSLPWITPAMAQAIIDRRKMRRFISVDELSELRGFDAETLNWVAAYLLCRTAKEPPSYRLENRHRFSIKQQRSRGFVDDVFAGDRCKLYNRLRFEVNQRLRLGLMTEKDPGESQFTDLTRAYIATEIPTWHSEIIVGHFSIESGQGLVYAPSFQIGRTFDPVLNAGRTAVGLRPNVSAAETGGYYGIALRWHKERSELLIFASRNRWDATVENDTVRSILLSGLHRTATERDRKNTLAVRTQGIICSHIFFRQLKLALVWRSNTFSDFLARGTEVKDRHDFSGRYNGVIGMQGDFFRGPMHIFAEWAQNRVGADAYKCGMRLQGNGRSLLLSWHHFSPAFKDPQAEWCNVDNANETGLYGAARCRIAATLTLAAYCDYRRNPWPRYRLPMPDFSRFDHYLGIEWQPRKTVGLLFRLRHHRQYLTETVTDAFGNEIKKIALSGNRHATAQLDLCYRRIQFRSRLEFRIGCRQLDSPPWRQTVEGHGLLFWQQAQIQPLSPLTITARYGLFDAADYDNRFYSFENDLPGVWRNKMLYGRGLRWFLLFAVRPCARLKVGSKWEGIVYDDKAAYGSGWDQVNSSYENMISLQLDWDWQRP